MAINWLVALQAIPWGQVIENAPKLIDATKRLFTKAKSIDPPREIVIDSTGATDDTVRIVRLERLVEENRHETIVLHEGLQAATKLLDELAGQNARMVGEIESLRRRGRMQGWCLAILLALVLAGVIVKLF